MASQWRGLVVQLLVFEGVVQQQQDLQQLGGQQGWKQRYSQQMGRQQGVLQQLDTQVGLMHVVLQQVVFQQVGRQQDGLQQAQGQQGWQQLDPQQLGWQQGVLQQVVFQQVVLQQAGWQQGEQQEWVMVSVWSVGSCSQVRFSEYDDLFQHVPFIYWASKVWTNHQQFSLLLLTFISIFSLGIDMEEVVF
jgi:hypothetical protein